MIGRVTPWVGGGVVSCVCLRFFFGYPPGVFHVNHEGTNYVARVVEFHSLLAAGYPFPQWAVDFRGGLGSPYFGYYQPGFFYVASLFATVLPAVKAIGATLLVFSLLGYSGMFALVRQRFGMAAGVLAGTALLLSNYARVDVYWRGDFSEYCGMMMLPPLLYWLTSWLEDGRRGHWLAIALGCATLVLLHPAAALFGYGALALTALCYTVAARSWRRALWAGGALAGGAGVAAFYWLSVLLEWQLVQGDLAIAPPYKYVRHFVEPQQLLGFAGRPVLLRVDLGLVVSVLVAIATLLLALGHRRVTPPQWRLVAALWLLVAVCVFMMSPASEAVWTALPLLERVQFPWRLLLLLTVAAAALSGCTPLLARSLMCIGIAWLAYVWLPVHPQQTTSYALPATPADVVKTFVCPDGMNEWLPRNAVPVDPIRDPSLAEPRCEPNCRVAGFTRLPGRLLFHLNASGPATITLPHYYFPVGWTVAVDGHEHRGTITPSREGFMRLVDVTGELIELTFTTTPGRRLGARVSALSLAVLLLVAWLWLPRSEADDAGTRACRRSAVRARAGGEASPARAGPPPACGR